MERMKRKKKKLMTTLIIHPVYREGTEILQVQVQYKVRNQNLYTDTSWFLIWSYPQILWRHPSSSVGSTAWHETHNCRGPVFLRSHRDLKEANASGHNAKQSFRYLVTIRKLPTPGLTEKRKFWLRLEERQMAVNRGLNSSFGLWRLWRATHANLKFWESWSSAD